MKTDTAKFNRLMKKRKIVAARRERWKKRFEEKLKELKEEVERLKERKAAAMETEDSWEEIAAAMTESLKGKETQIAGITESLEEWKEEITSLSLDMWSDDGKVFAVDDLCVVESEEIYEWILIEESHRCHTDIESEILGDVLKFCVERASKKAEGLNLGEEAMQDLAKDFDSAFLEQLSSTSCRYIAKLLRAACELQVKSLANLTSTALVTMMGEKDTREILKVFNYTGMITSKEMGSAMKLEPWARDMRPARVKRVKGRLADQKGD